MANLTDEDFEGFIRLLSTRLARDFSAAPHYGKAAAIFNDAEDLGVSGSDFWEAAKRFTRSTSAKFADKFTVADFFEYLPHSVKPVADGSIHDFAWYKAQLEKDATAGRRMDSFTRITPQGRAEGAWRWTSLTAAPEGWTQTTKAGESVVGVAFVLAERKQQAQTPVSSDALFWAGLTRKNLEQAEQIRNLERQIAVKERQIAEALEAQETAENALRSLLGNDGLLAFWAGFGEKEAA